MEGSEKLSGNEKRDFVIFTSVILAIGIFLFSILNNAPQALAGTIFAASVIGTLMFWRFRVGIAFIGVVLLLSTKTIDMKHTLEFMNFDVIIFLVGMMILVALVRDVGFFSWLGVRITKIAKFDAKKILMLLLCLSAVMAALVDEVTAILFISALVIDISDYYKINPVKYIIAVVLATNIGSSWTVLGNPIGILIALRAELTFEDFIRWALPVGLLSLIALIAVVLIWLRKDLKIFQENIDKKINIEDSKAVKELIEAVDVTIDKKALKAGMFLFFIVIAFIALHYRIESILTLEKNTFLIIASIAGAGIAMLWKRDKAQKFVESVDWWTLVFFMFLFAKAGTIAYVGLADRLAGVICTYTGSALFLIVLIGLISAFGSSVIDNVVLVATFIPVISSLGVTGTHVFPLWWALLFGGCYGGNITQVGSTANIVALGVLEKRKHYYITLREWLPIGLVAGILPTLIGLSVLLVQLPIMP